MEATFNGDDGKDQLTCNTRTTNLTVLAYCSDSQSGKMLKQSECKRVQFSSDQSKAHDSGPRT